VGASDVLNALSSFLLSFFVTLVIERWWSMMELFQELNSTARTIAHSVCTHMPGARARVYREQLIRLGWLANVLAVMAFRRDDDLSHIKQYSCIDVFALTPAEEQRLAGHKPNLRVWIVTQWMDSTILKAVSAGVVVTPEIAQPVLYTSTHALHSCSSKLLHIIERQIPFSYVHLLTVVVKVTVLFLSLEYGYHIGLLYLQYSYGLMCVDAIGVLLVNFFYQGLLNLFAVLSRPWFEHPAHVPRFAVMRNLQRELIALHEAAHDPDFAALDDAQLQARPDLTRRVQPLAALG
jgi:predicted membrane chloride channel (bestrophin family)